MRMTHNIPCEKTHQCRTRIDIRSNISKMLCHLKRVLLYQYYTVYLLSVLCDLAIPTHLAEWIGHSQILRIHFECISVDSFDVLCIDDNLHDRKMV